MKAFTKSFLVVKNYIRKVLPKKKQAVRAKHFAAVELEIKEF